MKEVTQMEPYKVIAAAAEAELVEKKSRFIGNMLLTKSEDEAKEFIADIRSKHKDATHVVYTYILKNPFVTRFSDDGEPQGTAGKPALEVLQREGIWDVTLTITRYFGGTLLGAGGLVRAYAKTAKLTLDAAGIALMKEVHTAEISLPYTTYGKVEDYLKSTPIRLIDTNFQEDVTLKVLLEPASLPQLQSFLQEETSGRVAARIVKTEFMAFGG